MTLMNGGGGGVIVYIGLQFLHSLGVYLFLEKRHKQSFFFYPYVFINFDMKIHLPCTLETHLT